MLFVDDDRGNVCRSAFFCVEGGFRLLRLVVCDMVYIGLAGAVSSSAKGTCTTMEFSLRKRAASSARFFQQKHKVVNVTSPFVQSLTISRRRHCCCCCVSLFVPKNPNDDKNSHRLEVPFGLSVLVTFFLLVTVTLGLARGCLDCASNLAMTVKLGFGLQEQRSRCLLPSSDPTWCLSAPVQVWLLSSAITKRFCGKMHSSFRFMFELTKFQKSTGWYCIKRQIKD